ncbi:MAG: hypothetical protein Phyf2KO_16630 [Phycisphaerales bacterium]
MGSLRALEERAIGVMPDPECSGSERAGGSVGIAGAAILALALITGCSSKVARLERPPAFVDQRSSWSLVMPPAHVDGTITIAAGPESSRRNDDLNLVIPTAKLATDEWPSEARPDLRYNRRLYLPTRARDYLYFSSSRSYERRSNGRSGTYYYR